jgi:YidC/Oxa1 family membrane protein insertase
MEERRLLLAVALSLVVLTAYSLLFAPARPPAEKPGAGAPAPTPTSVATPHPAPPPTLAPVAAPGQTPPPRRSPVPARAAAEEQRVEVHAPAYTVAFTNRGARLLSWTLLDYRDAEGQPEEAAPAPLPDLRPLDLVTGDPALDERLREALFVPSGVTVSVPAARPAELTFSYSDGEVEAEKSFRFPRTGLVEVRASVRRGGEGVPCRLVFGPGLGNPTAAERSVRGYQAPEGVALVDGKVERFTPKKLEAAGQTVASARWVGVESHYFAVLFVGGAGGVSAQIRPVTLPAAEGSKAEVAAAVAVAVPEGPLGLFVGAKDHQQLASLGHDLQRVVPMGEWIGPIAVVLLRLLRVVHGGVGNWGWAIVILTVGINMAMAPLRHYSIANGLKMAKLQPELKVIQERYRKVPLMDPRRQQMQEEMNALYTRHGTSMGTQMLVGCLPLLLTMPFLFAFYRVLSVSVELRGAPFLWIPDLSRPDPLYLTPVLMGVSMYAMQKMTPSTMDPSQQRIMMLMPIMLAGMFLWAAAGLNLYWLTANLWSIVQQIVEMRVLRPAGAPEARKGKKRR